MRQILWLVLVLVGCRSVEPHAVMTPEVLDFGTIAIDDSKTLSVSFDNLMDEDVYLYMLAPSTFEADWVPAGDDQGTPFDLDEEIVLGGSQELSIDVSYGCWAQDHGFFRWEITVLSGLEDSGYWEATREVGELTLMGSCE